MERTAAAKVKIRSVVFDFGNVICFPPSQEKIERAAADAKLPVDEFLRALWKDRLPYDAGVSPRDYWRGVAAHASTEFDDVLIERLVRHEVGFWNTFDDRVLAWMEQLRDAGYTIGILSNLPNPVANGLRETPGFMERFDHVTFSCELHLFKPQPAIYQHSFKGLNVAPEETLFIDDRQENVDGARAAGMNAELFTLWEEFSADVPAKYELPQPTR